MSNIDDQTARTIKEFCARNRISHSTYFELRHQKKGPREMRVLGKVLITPEAEADWRRECEIVHDDATVERFQERGRKAARGLAARGLRR
ncbi:MAG: hypothetical protein WBG18_17425 [Xanthobacteraceae bacterium]